jgi:hypothetical protein
LGEAFLFIFILSSKHRKIVFRAPLEARFRADFRRIKMYPALIAESGAIAPFLSGILISATLPPMRLAKRCLKEN